MPPNAGSAPGVSSALHDELATVIAEGRSTQLGLSLLEALESPDPRLFGPAGVQLHTFGERVKELVVEDSRFPGTSVHLIRRGNSGSGFYPYFVGTALVQRAMELGCPDAAIDWLRKVLATKSAKGRTIQALWGVPLDQEVQLTPMVRLVPIESLPESNYKRKVTKCPAIGSHSVTTMLHTQPATSALILERTIDPFMVDEQYDFISGGAAAVRSSTLLQDIALALTAVGPRASLPCSQWFEFDDPDLEAAGFGWTMSKLLEIVPARLPDYPLLDVGEAKRVVQQYSDMHEETGKGKMTIALQRLNQAQRRHNVGDQAVELSIAFEALVGDEGNTEMTHKVKVRSVRVLGGTVDVRAKNAKIISNTYAIRSGLVHKGTVATKSKDICGQTMTPTEIIDQATVMCADLIKNFLGRGSIPKWEEFDVREQS